MRHVLIFLLLLSILYPIQTNANPITYNLSSGQKVEARDVMFLNDHSSDIHVYLTGEGDLANFLKIKNPEIDIPKGEKKWIEYDIYIPHGTKARQYTGYIVATVNGYGDGAKINLAIKKRITVFVTEGNEFVDFAEFVISLVALLIAAYLFLKLLGDAKKRLAVFLLLLTFAPLLYAPSQNVTASVDILYTCGIINEPTNLDFGSFASGQYSQVKNTTVTNTGNVDVNISIHGTNWTSGTDSFSVENTKYSLDKSNYFALTLAPTIIYNNLSPASSLSIFFKVYAPPGYSGKYEQSITVGGICP